ncbi:hypothetical protein [Prevotella histicola]|uniref:Protein BatD n=1 Tax=Prevotella histicola F0411 TaxID=857291 RepID=G6AEC1_9BACT|nr:hypothetical protein [Prevotella histicola]EHG17120.1 hypothetical protein HMPREF9138_00448 [Prevotella histicola F0411]QUB83133.1 DUF4381 domain-containing protein [Prevotella histicola]
MRKYIVIIILLINAVKVSHAQVQVTAQVDPTDILIGGRAHFSIVVNVPKGETVSFPMYKNNEEMIPGLEVLSVKRDTMINGNRMKVREIYTLTGWDEKKYLIPVQKVLVGGNIHYTHRFVLNVRAIPIDVKRNVAKAPDDIFQLPFAWGEWTPILFLSLLAFSFLGISLYLYNQLRNKNKIWSSVHFKKPLTPYEKVLHDIGSIRANIDSYRDQKVYYSELTDILKKYISWRFGVNGLEMTSTEIIGILKSRCEEDSLGDLIDLLYTIDLVKFAKFSTGENDKLLFLDSITHFVHKTQITEPNVDKKQEHTKIDSPRSLVKLSIAVLISISIALLIYVVAESYILLNL